MQRFVLLYWGCVILMALSHWRAPTVPALYVRHTGRWHFLRCRSDPYLVLAVVWMTCFSCLRTDYNDTFAYRTAFANAKSLADGFADGTFTNLFGDPLSALYQSLLRSLTDNYHVYFLFPALLSSLAAVKLFKRYSVDPALSVLLFFSCGSYLLYLAALKQALASFFLMLALPYAIDRRYVRFCLLVLTAALFHVHALFFLLAPLLTKKPWGWLTWAAVATAVLAILAYDRALDAFSSLMELTGAPVHMGELFDGHAVNGIRVLVFWVPGLLALLFCRPLFAASTRAENLFVNLSILSACILSIGLVQAANLFGRMAGYFSFATAVALPWMIRRLFTPSSARVVSACAVLLYFGYFLYENTVSGSFSTDYRAISLAQFVWELLPG